MRVFAAAALGGLLAGVSAFSQQAEPAAYKVVFSIREEPGPAAKSPRQYVLLTDAGGKATFRVGQKVPVVTGGVQGSQSGAMYSQFQYLDTGMNIDCRVRETGSDKVALNADIDISSIVAPEKTAAANAPNPTVGSTRLSASAMPKLGKPTLIASIDDPVTARKFEVIATVTKTD